MIDHQKAFDQAVRSRHAHATLQCHDPKHGYMVSIPRYMLPHGFEPRVTQLTFIVNEDGSPVHRCLLLGEVTLNGERLSEAEYVSSFQSGRHYTLAEIPDSFSPSPNPYAAMLAAIAKRLLSVRLRAETHGR
jgi:hypothetical protein